MKISKINVPAALWQRIVSYYKETYIGVIPPQYLMEDFSKHRLESVLVQIKRLKVLGVNKKDKCLDAGCGIGSLVTLGNLLGYDYYGYEIDRKAADIARDLLKANGISPNKIRFDPNFKNLKFDFISSFETVEHVADLNDYLRKLRKIIKKEGRLFIETPNYSIPYEPHFYIFFPPGPTILKWWCCQLAGRTNKKFFDELRFVTPRTVELALQNQGFEFENLGVSEWSDLLIKNEVQGRSIYIQLLSQFLRITRLSGLARWFASMGIYTPLVYLSKPK